jgi:hypothetical protein
MNAQHVKCQSDYEMLKLYLNVLIIGSGSSVDDRTFCLRHCAHVVGNVGELRWRLQINMDVWNVHVQTAVVHAADIRRLEHMDYYNH